MAEGMRNFVPQLLKKRGWSEREFRIKIMQANLSVNTADRLLAGETDFSVRTLEKIARHVFNVKSISEIVDLDKEA